MFAKLLSRLRQMQIEPAGALGELGTYVEHPFWRNRTNERQADEVDRVIAAAVEHAMVEDDR